MLSSSALAGAIALACAYAHADRIASVARDAAGVDAGAIGLPALPDNVPTRMLLPMLAHSVMVVVLAIAPPTFPFRAAFLHKLRVFGLRVRVRLISGLSALWLLAAAATRWLHGAPLHEDRALLLLAVGLLQAHAYHVIWLNEAGETEAILNLERELERREMTAWAPPAREKFCVAPPLLHAALQPKFLGVEHVPKETGKLLFVMNHQMGGFEIPLFLEYCHLALGLFPRALADHLHFYIPAWGQALREMGAIDGTRENCSLVMRLGQPMLVFPGGGNEIMKSKQDAKYALKWKERAGFARIAIEHGYTIVPVAAAGLEDQLDVLADIPVGKVLASVGAAKGSRAELTLPVMLPNASHLGQRLYFRFLEPVHTAALGADKAADKEAVMAVRNLVKDRLEAGLKALLEERELDPERFLVGGGGGGGRSRLSQGSFQ